MINFSFLLQCQSPPNVKEMKEKLMVGVVSSPSPLIPLQYHKNNTTISTLDQRLSDTWQIYSKHSAITHAYPHVCKIINHMLCRTSPTHKPEITTHYI